MQWVLAPMFAPPPYPRSTLIPMHCVAPAALLLALALPLRAADVHVRIDLLPRSPHPATKIAPSSPPFRTPSTTTPSPPPTPMALRPRPHRDRPRHLSRAPLHHPEPPEHHPHRPRKSPSDVVIHLLAQRIAGGRDLRHRNRPDRKSRLRKPDNLTIENTGRQHRSGRRGCQPLRPLHIQALPPARPPGHTVRRLRSPVLRR